MKKIIVMLTTFALCFSMFIGTTVLAAGTITAHASYDPSKTTVTITGTATSSIVTITIATEANPTPICTFLVSTTSGNYSKVYTNTNFSGDYIVTVKNNSDKTTATDTFTTADAELQSAIEAATTAVTEAFEAYTDTDYTDENWTALVAIKDTALAAIAEATAVEAVTTLKDDAIAEMIAIPVITAADSVIEGISGLASEENYTRTNILDLYEAYSALSAADKALVSAELVTALNNAKKAVDDAAYDFVVGAEIDTAYGKVKEVNVNQGLAPDLNNGKILVVTEMNDGTQVLQMFNYTDTIAVNVPTGNIKSVSVVVVDLGTTVVNSIYYNSVPISAN